MEKVGKMGKKEKENGEMGGNGKIRRKMKKNERR